MNTVQPPKSTRAKVVYAIWNNMPRLVLVGLIVLIVLLGISIKGEQELIAAEKKNAIAQERAPINAIILELNPDTIQDRINLPGNVEPWTRLNLMAEVGGKVTKVLVKEGDKVQVGDVLAKIDFRDYRITLDRATAAYKLAKANFERDSKVYAKGVIPTAQIEAQKTSMQTAKADLDNAKLMLEKCTIKAPIAGVINKLDAEIGLLLSVGDPLAEILEIDRLKAVIGIPESDVTAVRKLDTVDITVQALNDKVYTGHTYFLSSSPSTAARLYRMELAIDNSNGELLPGMFIRADIVKQVVEDGLAIPFYSVISRNDEQYVFVEKDGVVQKRIVEMGIMESWLVEITEGLEAGENVVIEGHRDIENNQKVNVVKTITNPGEFTL